MRRISLINFIFIALLVTLAACVTTTPLGTAVNEGNIKEVEALLNKGADVNARDYSGRNALGWAAEKGHTEMMKLLIDKGADVNKGCSGFDYGLCGTALMHAAKKGKIEVMKLLIDKGADVNARDYHGRTALVWAAWNHKTEAMKLLIDKGANLDVAIAYFDKTTVLRDPDWYYTDRQQPLALLEKFKSGFKPEQEIANQPSQAISKADIAEIVKATIEGTVKAQKKEPERTTVISDINKPMFAASEALMSDNDLAVIIGIEGYQNIPKSDYSYDDAKLVKEYAKALGFKERNIELLLDEKATKSSIERSLEAWLKNKAKPDSRIFVYYSGHGAPEPKTGDAYLVPYDGDPNYLEVTGYSLKRLYDNLGKLQVKEVTVVLDSCFSGAGGRSVLAQGARPLVMMTTSTVLPSNIAILSATQGTQISTSSTEKGHGVFTYYFLKALKEGKKTIAEIYEYIKPLVEDEAKQLNVQQSPSISPDAEKIKGRFILRK
jgi:hypothetical protein